ncbi:MAG TPA: hypothetical protein VE592_00875 [Geminicoccaceae bacterium]|jgi:hypothetical protein|nr:hypothetical protein [Geminicoccaceae bacterium]
MATAHRKLELARSGLVVVILLWAGVVIGVSLLAAPAKFMAPGLSLPVAMEIGQREFHTLNVVETGLAVVALALAAPSRPGRTIWLGLGLAAVLVIAQGLWLLPVLDARAEIIIDGGTPPDAPWHAIYVGAELSKLLVLLVTGWLALRRLRDG